MIKYLDEDVQVSSASSLPKLEIPQDDKYMLGKLSRVEGDTWASTPPPLRSLQNVSVTRL